MSNTKNYYKIFYSWQSDINAKENRYFIEECLKKTIKPYIKYISIDRDTKNMQGAPSIEQVIFEKIDECDLFIADISLVGRYGKKFLKTKGKATPNPNVMFELGYAVSKLTWERIICIFNEDTGDINDLPFDIKIHRHFTYSLKGKEKNAVKKEMSNDLSSIISNCYNAGPSVKKNFAYERLYGFDYKSEKINDKLISYDGNTYPSLIIEITKYKNNIKNLYKKLSTYKVETRVPSKTIEIGKDTIGKLVAMTYNKIQDIDLEPEYLDEVIDSLKKYFDIESKREYFAFGNLKKHSALHNSYFGSNDLSGTQDEKNKYYKYRELFYKINLYKCLLEFKQVLAEYKIIPFVISNNSSITDEDIDINITLSNSESIDSKALNRKMDGYQYLLCSENVFTNVFYNQVLNNEIKNDNNPYNYNIKEIINNDILPKDEDVIAMLNESILSFYRTNNGLETSIHLKQLKANEKKWLGKVLIVKSDSSIKIKYDIKSKKSSGKINLSIET